MHRVLALLMVVLPAVASAQRYDGPPGLSPSGPEVDLLVPPNVDAPDQREVTPGLELLHQMMPKQELHVGDHRVVIELDGSVDVTPLYGVLTLRFGFKDPYSLQIRRTLEATFEQRAAMHQQYREAAMEFALTDLPLYLELVWAHPTWSVETRKRILFELWDECAERGPEYLVQGGAAARELIESFIRYQLPAHGQHHFSPAELARLNRIRSSSKPFAPYDRHLAIPGRLVVAALTF